MKFFYSICFLIVVSLHTRAQQKQDLNIVFIGNSITYGGGIATRKDDAPPNEACAWLRKQSEVGEVAFANQGVSGRTTVDFLPATNTQFPKVMASARSFANTNAQLVFSIKLGTNDSAVQGPNGAPVSPENYYANLQTITDSLLHAFPNCKVIYQQPIWYSPNTHNRATYMQEGLTRLQTYFPQLKKLVKAYKKDKPGHVFMGDTQAFKFFKKHYKEYLAAENGQDGVFYLHPNKEGAAVLGDFWARAIYREIVR